MPPNPPHSHTHPPLLIPIGASRRWAPRRAQGGTGGGHRGGHSPTPGITPPGAVQNRSALCREVGAGTGFNPQRAVSPRPQGTDAVCVCGGGCTGSAPPYSRSRGRLWPHSSAHTSHGGRGLRSKGPRRRCGGGRKASVPPPLSPHPPTALSPIPGLWGGGGGLSPAAVEALMRSGCGAGGGAQGWARSTAVGWMGWGGPAPPRSVCLETVAMHCSPNSWALTSGGASWGGTGWGGGAPMLHPPPPRRGDGDGGAGRGAAVLGCRGANRG